MTNERVERRLAAILVADLAGYSRLMHNDEEATHARLTTLMADTVLPAIARHGGRVVKSTGDGFLADFPSAVRAETQFQDRVHELAIGETEVTRVLSMAPQHATAHLALGAVQMFTNRAAQGIGECEHALALDRNLADAHGCIGMAKYFAGRAEETEAHIFEALRLSPRDVHAYRWMLYVGIAKAQLGADAEAVAWLRRSMEANRNFPLRIFILQKRWRCSASSRRRRSRHKRGLRSSRALPSAATARMR